ncbi:unnamed protein product [Vitrella brassicaformis CCMP3155]|uniref:Uncharacterized protein n=1 Tax=Vitrella brassicaformis (strain CCMP3155) TaxID=1169540 RepID=A0A0G4FK50_VITBC|nr:unnamed protein product [Vitrella brassicaformis CCMP3155]|mmetsp:Transcript_8932/g.21927  ORF Transcript_8932/g.21927 Transcript_8932/m.21927 type:complete len:88 (-) Transcript_8932:1128-1391(-)|eukprot:CEM14154.1 unnamed protein product [Vitrella brassicaformis CCMP3155]
MSADDGCLPPPCKKARYEAPQASVSSVDGSLSDAFRNQLLDTLRMQVRQLQTQQANDKKNAGQSDKVAHQQLQMAHGMLRSLEQEHQ